MVQQTTFLDAPAQDKPATLDSVEQWLVEQSPTWVDEYLFLRSQKIPYRYALLAVWLSLKRDDRGEIKTREDLANLFGVSKQTTYEWEAKHPEIREQYVKQLLLRRMGGSRLAEVDQMTYKRAIAADGTHNDRKLFYQRAGVYDENPAGEDQEQTINIVLDGKRGDRR